MDILLKRTNIHDCSTEGRLTVGGTTLCDTIEHTPTRLSAGVYPLHIGYCHQHRRCMLLAGGKTACSQCPKLDFVCHNTILPTYCPMLKPGNGVYERADGSIIVGEHFVPGFLIHPKCPFDTLYQCLRKVLARGTPVELIISDPSQ